MIKVLTGYLNPKTKEFVSLFDNNKNVEISDWFQLIFLSLIDNNLDNSLGKNPDVIQNFETNFLRKDKEINKNVLLRNLGQEKLDQINSLLAYVLDNNNLELFSIENLAESGSYNYQKNIFSEISEGNNENLGIYNKEKFSFIEEIISQINNAKEINFPQLNQIFENILKKSLPEFKEIDISAIKGKVLQLSNNFSDFKNVSFRSGEDDKNVTNLAKDGDLQKINESFVHIKNLIAVKDEIQNKQNSENPFHLDKHLDKESLQTYISVFNSENENQSGKGERLEVKNNNNKNGVKELNEDIFLFKKAHTNDSTLENEKLLIKNKGEVSKEFGFYDALNRVLNKKVEVETYFINRFFDDSFTKGDLGIKDVIKSENVKVVNFYKFPDEFLEIIKSMSFEIQPEGEKRAFIKLEPPDMGFLNLEIKTKNKDIEIIVRVEKPEVLQDIKNNLHNIKASLEELGLNLKEFQLFLGSGLENKAFTKNFEREGSPSYKKEIQEIEEVSKNTKEKDTIKVYNTNGKYYYIV